MTCFKDKEQITTLPFRLEETGENGSNPYAKNKDVESRLHEF